jgi:hypothetical protein
LVWREFYFELLDKYVARAAASVPVAGKIYFRRSAAHVEEGKHKIRLGESGLGYVCSSQPSKDNSAPQRGWQFSQGRAAKRIPDFGNERCHPGFLLTKNLRSSENGRAERSSQSVLDFGDDPVPEPVAGVRNIRIGAILSIGDASLGHERSNLLACQAKHRAKDFKSVAMCQRPHASKPGCSAPAKEIKEAGFDLVVAMVGEEDPVAAVVLRARLEKRISQVACGCLEGESFVRGVGADVRFAKFERIAQFFRDGADKQRIGICGGTAQAMVQMAHN